MVVVVVVVEEEESGGERVSWVESGFLIMGLGLGLDWD